MCWRCWWRINRGADPGGGPFSRRGFNSENIAVGRRLTRAFPDDHYRQR